MRAGSTMGILTNLAIAAAICLAVPTDAATTLPQGYETGEKELVTDGHVFHDVGDLWLHVTNWGLIGSHPTMATPYSQAPSAQLPGGYGPEYLWGAGLWVGGVLLGERLVSTGQYQTEFRPSDAPEDTIYRTAIGAVGGSRFPWRDPDDDGDGMEDEDPLNGRDDDGDGLVDEDFAAISQQHFRCELADNRETPYPDHTPLNLEVVQQSFQWSFLEGNDFVGFEFTIRNVGVVDIDNVYIGFFADCDIPAREPGASDDDMAGYFNGLVQDSQGEERQVTIAYMYDGDEAVLFPGYFGVLLLDHTTDPGGVTAPETAAVRSLQIIRAQTSFDQGGEPTNDSERYEALSMDSYDANVPAGQQDDYRILISSGPFPSLAPGGDLTYSIALVGGSGYMDMLHDAAEAVRIYQGRRFNRDGDPATGPDGKEYVVRWLHPDEVPVAVARGSLLARTASGGVAVDIETNLDSLGEIILQRRAPGAEEARSWQEADFSLVGQGLEGLRASVIDEDACGWPRTYTLVLEGIYREVVLDRIELQGPRPLDVRLATHPNPFNPRIDIRYALPMAQSVRLDVFDSRGRLLKNLLSGPVPAGEGSVVWEGVDAGGRPVASGVYHVQLTTEQSVMRRSVTLIR